MKRWSTPSFLCLVLLACLASFIAVTAVWAEMIYSFTATSQYDYVPSFSLLFNDTNMNGRFSLDELVPGTLSFTGDQSDGAYLAIIQVAAVTGYTDLSPSPLPHPDRPDLSWFTVEGQSDFGWYPVRWTYEINPVPLPASAFLLGSGLLGLAGWRRFRKG